MINTNDYIILVEWKKQYEERVQKEPRHSGIIELEKRIKRYEDMIKKRINDAEE